MSKSLWPPKSVEATRNELLKGDIQIGNLEAPWPIYKSIIAAREFHADEMSPVVYGNTVKWFGVCLMAEITYTPAMSQVFAPTSIIIRSVGWSESMFHELTAKLDSWMELAFDIYLLNSALTQPQLHNEYTVASFPSSAAILSKASFIRWYPVNGQLCGFALVKEKKTHSLRCLS